MSTLVCVGLGPCETVNPGLCMCMREDGCVLVIARAQVCVCVCVIVFM